MKPNEFNAQVRITIKNRQDGTCLFCNNPIDHIHHALVGRRVGLGVERNGVGLCCRHHLIIHGSGKLSSKLNVQVKVYLHNKYGEIDLEELKYNKWNKFKFRR